MKRSYIILIVILSLITICVSLQQTDKPDFIVKDKSYEIIKIKNSSDFKYKYVIYDNNHNEIDKGTIFRIEPRITNINGILQLCVGAGTGLENCRYYDIEKTKISSWYETPILSNGKVIVRLNKLTMPTGIIVENIFDDYNFYKEYDINFSDKEVWPLEDIKFINNTIKITYVSDKEKLETKVINLN